jgi:hypothetical protein
MSDQTPLFGESKYAMQPDPMPELGEDSDSSGVKPLSEAGQLVKKFGKKFTGAGGHVFYVGDKALLTGKFAGLTYVIEKINPTTALLVSYGGSTPRRVKASHSLVYALGTLPGDFLLPVTAPTANFRPGNLVRIAGLPQGKKFGGLGNGDIGVVLRYSGKRVSVVQAGGSPDGGYALFSPARLTLVTVTQLFDYLGTASGVLPL